MRRSTTTGLTYLADFPADQYEAVQTATKRFSVTDAGNAPPVAWREWASAWNALQYRYHSCNSHNLAFSKVIEKDGASHDDLFIQDRELFGFFVTELSTLESFCYAAYALGSLVRSTDFPIATNVDRKNICIALTATKFKNLYPNKRISKALDLLQNSEQLQVLRDVRNVMAHRTVPPKIVNVHVTIGPESPLQQPNTTVAIIDDSRCKTNGTHKIQIDDQTTRVSWQWLAGEITELVEGAADFAHEEF